MEGEVLLPLYGYRFIRLDFVTFEIVVVLDYTIIILGGLVMGMKIRFDTTNRPENPTLILATKTGKKLGLIVASGISIKDSMKNAAEITFNVNKYLNGRKNRLWNKIKDFRLYIERKKR